MYLSVVFYTQLGFLRQPGKSTYPPNGVWEYFLKKAELLVRIHALVSLWKNIVFTGHHFYSSAN